MRNSAYSREMNLDTPGKYARRAPHTSAGATRADRGGWIAEGLDRDLGADIDRCRDESERPD
eukprot:1473914-Pyramimonas_sp.AAC.1